MTDPSSLDSANLGLSRFQLDQSLKAGKSIELVIPKSGVYDALRVKGRVLELSGPVFLEAGSTLVVRLNGTTNVLELSAVKPPDRSVPVIDGVLQRLIFDSLESVPLASGTVRDLFASLFRGSLGSPEDGSSVQVLFRDRDAVRGVLSEMLKIVDRQSALDSTFSPREAVGDEQRFVNPRAPWLLDVSPKLQQLIRQEGWVSLERVLENFKPNSDKLHSELGRSVAFSNLEDIKLAIQEVANRSPTFATFPEFSKIIEDFVRFLKVPEGRESPDLVVGSILTRIESILTEHEPSQVVSPEDQRCIEFLRVLPFILDDLLESAPNLKSSSHKVPALVEHSSSHRFLVGDSKGKTEEEYLSMLRALLVSQIDLIDRLPHTARFDHRNLFVFPYLLEGNFGSVIAGLFDDAEEGEARYKKGVEPKADLRFELKLPFLGSIKGEIFLSKQLVQLDFHDPDSYKYANEKLGALGRRLGSSWTVRARYTPIRSQRREKI
jgi:hypothetical protein